MSNDAKPRLLFLRFTQPNIPSFLQRHLHEHVRCLSQHFDVTVITDESCDYRQLCETYEPDIAMFESGSYVGKRDVRNADSFPTIPKVGFMSCDAYCPTRIKAIADMDKWGISTFFGNSVSLPSYTPSIAEQFFVWPNFVSPETFRDYQLPKIIPVLFTGSQASNYPWRNRIDRIVSQRYPSLHSPHFGFQWQNGKPSATSFFEGERYAQLINSAWLAPTCGTICNEVVRKHFEIPACGTCLLTQKTAALEAAGFVDFVNCVFADECDVLDRLQWLFDRPEELARITKAGKELVDSRHTIRQRNQVFQWYTLHRQLKPGQKIVQPGPFLPLTTVDENSGAQQGHVSSAGDDRVLMSRGDDALRTRQYCEAEKLYRQCNNYLQVDLPEARLRLILCWLYQGRSRAALSRLREHFPSHRVSNPKDFEPDPTEWAWFIVVLLCCGKIREATLRARQFAAVTNDELDKVRCVVDILRGENYSPNHRRAVASARASVHQLPEFICDNWLEQVSWMLTSCAQRHVVSSLARVGPQLHSLVSRRHRSRQLQTGGTLVDGHQTRNGHAPVPSRARMSFIRFSDAFLKHYLAAGSRLKRLVSRNAERARRTSTLIRGSLVGRGPRIPDEDYTTIMRLFQMEDVKSAILVGANDGAWLSEAIVFGIQKNPQTMSAICVNRDTPGFRRLHRRLGEMPNFEFRYLPKRVETLEQNTAADIVAIDCANVSRYGGYDIGNPALIVLSRINSEVGHESFLAMQSNANYVLVLHEPSRCDGYSVFRRLARQSSILALTKSSQGTRASA